MVADLEETEQKVKGNELASALLNGVVTGFVDKVTFEQRLERSEEVSHAVTWGKSFPGKADRLCKWPGVHLVCLRSSKEAG